MGVSTIIRLPRTCGIQNVANVIGVLAGLKAEKSDFRKFSNMDGYSARVTGVSFNVNDTLPMSPTIVIRGDLIDEERIHHVMYFYENETWDGVTFNPPSTNFWVAIGKKLVDIFGGEVDYNDCDEWIRDYVNGNHGSIAENRPSKGDEWYAFQNMLLNLKSLTQEEMSNAFERRW